jgi:hypothetical protein
VADCKAKCPGRRAICAVGADEDARGYPFAVDQDIAVVESNLDTVAKLSAYFRSFPSKEFVKPTSLGHQAERLRALAFERPPVVQPQLETVHDVLDDGLDGERQLPYGPQR